MSDDSTPKNYRKCAEKRNKRTGAISKHSRKKKKCNKLPLDDLRVSSKKICRGRVTVPNQGGIYLKGVRSNFIERPPLNDENVARRNEDLCRLIDFGYPKPREFARNEEVLQTLCLDRTGNKEGHNDVGDGIGKERRSKRGGCYKRLHVSKESQLIDIADTLRQTHHQHQHQPYHSVQEEDAPDIGSKQASYVNPVQSRRHSTSRSAHMLQTEQRNDYRCSMTKKQESLRESRGHHSHHTMHHRHELSRPREEYAEKENSVLSPVPQHWLPSPELHHRTSHLTSKILHQPSHTATSDHAGRVHNGTNYTHRDGSEILRNKQSVHYENIESYYAGSHYRQSINRRESIEILPKFNRKDNIVSNIQSSPVEPFIGESPESINHSRESHRNNSHSSGGANEINDYQKPHKNNEFILPRPLKKLTTATLPKHTFAPSSYSTPKPFVTTSIEDKYLSFQEKLDNIMGQVVKSIEKDGFLDERRLLCNYYMKRLRLSQDSMEQEASTMSQQIDDAERCLGFCCVKGDSEEIYHQQYRIPVQRTVRRTEYEDYSVGSRQTGRQDRYASWRPPDNMAKPYMFSMPGVQSIDPATPFNNFRYGIKKKLKVHSNEHFLCLPDKSP